jgi:DNA-binding transcriptional regulator GbsR (MarR family)
MDNPSDSRRVAVFTSTSEPKRPFGTAEPSPLSWRLVRGDGRPADVIAFEESVIEFFLEAADILGAPKSLAAIYGVCFASPAPLSFTHVKERLGLSAGSVSQGLRILQNVNALKVVTSPNSKRELFEPDLELRKLIGHYLKERVEKQLNSGRERLRAMGSAIPEGPNGAGKILRARLKSLQSWHDKSRRLGAGMVLRVVARDECDDKSHDRQSQARPLPPRPHPAQRPRQKHQMHRHHPQQQHLHRVDLEPPGLRPKMIQRRQPLGRFGRK